MIDTHAILPFTRGQVVKCVRSDCYALTLDKEYEILDCQEGIFDSPYVQFKDDNGKECWSYSHRFEETEQ